MSHQAEEGGKDTVGQSQNSNKISEKTVRGKKRKRERRCANIWQEERYSHFDKCFVRKSISVFSRAQ